jgi:hypothetical protein
MKRMIVMGIAIALLTGLPAAAQAESGNEKAGDAGALTTPKAGERSAQRPEAGSQREKGELPIYIPPSRGSLPTRVGGASRGGQQRGSGL